MSSPRPTTTTMPGTSPEPTASTAASSMPLQSCADAWAELSASARERARRTAGRTATTTGSILSSCADRVDILRAMQSPMRRVFVTGGTGFERVHAQGTINVLEAAAAVGARRYVHMSALGTRAGAHSRYHQTKWAAEEAVRASPIPWTIFRPSIIYGRGDGFVTILASMIGRLPVVPVIGTGRQRLQPVPVAHVAQGFVRALSLDASVKHTYDVGGPEPVTMVDLLDRVAAAMGRRRPLKAHAP